MMELFRRLAARPGTTALLLVASFVINLLMLAAPLFVMLVLNRYVASGIDGTLIVLASGAIVAIAFEFVLRAIRLRIAKTVSVRADDDTAVQIADILMRARLGVFEGMSRPFLRHLARDGEVLQTAYSAPSLIAILDLPFTLVLLGALFLIEPVLAFIALTACLAMLLAGTVLGRAPPRLEEAGAMARGRVEEDLLGEPAVVRGFDARPMLLHYWQAGSRLLHAQLRQMAARRGLLTAISQSATALTTVAIVGLGAMLVVRQQMDIGLLIAANILAARALGGAIRAAHLTEVLSRAGQAGKRLGDMRKLPLEGREGTELAAYGGRIAFEDVTFAYQGKSQPLFERLDFKLAAGDILVVHGGNGTGKSTLADLVLGLRDPLRGSVLIDGIDLKQVALPWWRRQVCFLPQSPDFLNVSLRDNLTCLNPDTGEERFGEVLAQTGARDIIAHQANGLETVLTDQGRHLALGERKRLALARALVTDGRLAVFDEPLEGLDAAGRAVVGRVLTALSQRGVTMIVCSSDPNIIKEADWRLDLDRKPIPVLSRGPASRMGRAAE